MEPSELLPPEGVEPGDLLFFARPSLIQRWSEAVDDDFRGVAFADYQQGRLVMLQCGYPNGFEVKVVADVVDRYDVIGVGRVPACECVEDVLAWAWSRMADDNHYPLASLLPAFCLSWARNAPNTAQLVLRRALVVPPVAAVAGLLSVGAKLRARRAWTFICSTFVAVGMNNACPAHRLVGVIGRSKTPSRSQTCSRLSRLLERWYSTPSDLWRLLPPDRRFRLDIDDAPDDSPAAT